MQVPIMSAVGRGETLLSSFDDALRLCGVHNYNLLALSSVIPPGSEIQPVERYSTSVDEHGHRLYVVKADARSDEPGRGLAAGIGWYQWRDGRGVFVEHEATGPTVEEAEAEVRHLICLSLRDLCRGRDVEFDERRVGAKVAAATVADQPTTVLVLAVLQAEPWRFPIPTWAAGRA
jgi:arginine decarboxylase